MKQIVCALFLLFLAGTCEMQAISTTTVALNKVDLNPVVSLETLKSASAFVKEAFNIAKSKFDKNGNVDKIIKVLSGSALWKKIDDQTLLQESNTNSIALANKVLLGASVALLVATILRIAPWDKLTEKIKTKSEKLGAGLKKAVGILTPILYLIAAMLYFHGFMLLFDYLLDNGDWDLRSVGPIMIKVLASAFFTLQPMTSLMSGDTNNFGLLWPNLAGIILFHMGNLMSLFFTLQEQQTQTEGSFFKKNQGTISAFLFTAATSFLLTSIAGPEFNLQAKTANIYSAIGASLLCAG